MTGSTTGIGVILTTSLDRNTEAHKLLRELHPYLLFRKAPDKQYDLLLVRVMKLFEAMRRGSDGDIT